MLRIQEMYLDSIRCYSSYASSCVYLDKHGCFSRENLFGPTQKPQATSSAIFEIGTAAKYCELKRGADPVRSTEPTTMMKSLKVTYYKLFAFLKRQLSTL